MSEGDSTVTVQTRIREEETLLVNGVPVVLVGEEGEELKKALLSGCVPPKLLECILRAAEQGCGRNVKVQASLTVRNKQTNRETTMVQQNGVVMDQTTHETKREDVRETSEVWCSSPVMEPRSHLVGGEAGADSLDSGSYDSFLESVSSSDGDTMRPRSSCSSGSAASSSRSQFKEKFVNGIVENLKAEFGGQSANVSRSASAPSSVFKDNHSVPRSSSVPIEKEEDQKPQVPQRVHKKHSTEEVRRKPSPPPKPKNLLSKASLASKLKQVAVKEKEETSDADSVNKGTEVLQNGEDIPDRCFGAMLRVDSYEDPDPSIFGTVTSGAHATCDTCPNNKSSSHNVRKSSQSNNGLVNGSLSGDEGQQPQDSLVFVDGVLVSGPLEALIQHLVPTVDYYPDHTYVFALILSARLFITPYQLLGQVIQYARLDSNPSELGLAQDKLSTFCSNMLRLLCEWTETFPYDFRDERMMAHVKTVTQKCVAVDSSLRSQVQQILQGLLEKLSALEQYEHLLHTLEEDIKPRQLEDNCVKEVMSVCGSATVLAQQLTRLELERLSMVGPEEFLQAFAKETHQLHKSYRDIKSTSNLESYIHWFNHLSYFVATEVLCHPKKKQRAKVIEFWIEVGRECFNIGNFNSLMTIIAGLNMSPVARLKKSWARVDSSQLSVLEQQMSPGNNFTSYRSTLSAAQSRVQDTPSGHALVIPFFSLLLKDLYFFNEGCPDKMQNGHINMEKFWQLAKQVTEFMTWQRVTCPFAPIQSVMDYVQTGPVFLENTLSMASYECEPPENNTERERYKGLKSELQKETQSQS